MCDSGLLTSYDSTYVRVTCSNRLHVKLLDTCDNSDETNENMMEGLWYICKCQSAVVARVDVER